MTQYRNYLDERNRTLGELRTELKARLGFVTQGSGSKLVDPLLTSFLQEAYDYVFSELGATLSRRRTKIKTTKGSNLYDFHDDEADLNINPADVREIGIYETDTSYFPLRQGIDEQMRADVTQRGLPERWDVLNGQIELWPTPDQSYELSLVYDAGKNRFSQDADRPNVPDRLIFLYALASAKAHYGMADAKTAGSLFQSMLANAKADRLLHKRYTCATKKFDTRYFVRRTGDGKYTL
jgi:hypothetical protein